MDAFSFRANKYFHTDEHVRQLRFQRQRLGGLIEGVHALHVAKYERWIERRYELNTATSRGRAEPLVLLCTAASSWPFTRFATTHQTISGTLGDNGYQTLVWPYDYLELHYRPAKRFERCWQRSLQYGDRWANEEEVE